MIYGGLYMKEMEKTKSEVSNHGPTEKLHFSAWEAKTLQPPWLTRTKDEEHCTKLFIYWHSTDANLSPD